MSQYKIFIIFAFIILLAILGPAIAPYDPFQISGDPYQGISLTHILGTDGLGRDIFSQILSGSRITLFVAISAALICLVLSLVLGLLSSLRSIFSQIISAVVDSFIAVPPLFIMIFLGSIIGSSIYSEIIIIALAYWPQISKSYRAEVISLFERGYVDASTALGGNTIWIIRRHIIPNMAHLTLANFTYLTGVAIVSESILSFLGLGDQRYFSWGMIFYYAFLQGAIYYGLWQWILAPAVLITLIAYALFESSKDILMR
ncbi:MAG: ABC transporter permease [Ignisphaera sp.]